MGEREQSDSHVTLDAPVSVHRILRNSASSLAAQIFNALAQVLVLSLVARRLGRSVLGDLWPLLDLVTVVQLIAEAGTGTVLTRRLIQVPKDRAQTIAEGKSLFAIIMLGSVLTFGAIGALWSALTGDFNAFGRCLLAGLACAFIQLQRFSAGIFRASEMFGMENLSRGLQGVVFAATVCAQFGAGTESLTGLLAAFAFSQAVAGVFLLIAVRRRWQDDSWWRFTLSGWREWVNESLLLGSGDVVRQLMMQMDTILIRVLQSSAIAGIFTLAYKPLSALNWLPRAVLTAAFPSLARMASADPEQLRRAFTQTTRLLWVTSLPIAIAVGFGAAPLVRLMSEQNFDEFVPAVVLLRILIWIVSLSFLSAQFRFVLAAVGNLRSYTRLTLGAFVLKAALEIILIPRMSYYGACVASLTAETVFTFLGLLACERLNIGNVDWPSAGRAIGAGIAMAMVMAIGAWSLPMTLGTWLIESVLATIVYVAVCLASGALRWHELARLATALRTAPAAE